MEPGNQNTWFYVRNRQQEGPISLFELTKMFEQGVLYENTLIWNNDLDDWNLAGSLDQFSSFFKNTLSSVDRQELLPLDCLVEWQSLIRYIARMFDLAIFSSLVGILLTFFHLIFYLKYPSNF
ncbi:DUF4339 domain-containing protein [Neobacillus terrae]|uniref:DUF4339 domain-containing protein n=1 Tax=Neobacillus terrae TaxID=3034837 RepID=UPI00140C9EEB|nr:DUF4339 domain-containing protein [Neobacillus terrae]NHM31602.1 DUF4339 domain-containing protein [Neobacillus terrae]